MAFSNDLSIDADHRTPHPHAHATGETTTLLGRITSSSTTSTTRSSSRVSRFGLIVSLLAVVALSSSALVFLLNRGTTFPTSSSTDVDTIEVQVAKAQRPSSAHESSSDILDVLSSPSSMTSSFHAFETSDHVQYFTYEDFSGGESGKPIHVISIEDYQAQVIPPGGPTDLGNLLLTEANNLHATILITTSSDSVHDAIHDVVKKQGCIQDDNDPDNCLILIFEEKTSSTNEVTLAVSSMDKQDKQHLLVEVDPTDPNGIMEEEAAIEGQTDSYNALRTAYLHPSDDGILIQPDIMKTSPYVEDYCPLDPTSDTPNLCEASKENVYILALKNATHETKSTKIQSRLFNEKLPGPTIKIKPGETLKVQFKNELTLQDGTVSCYADDGTVTNEYCEPDHTNLHYHGYVGSGEKPSDDVEMRIAPESQYSYMSYFKKDHMPGTHWIHAHPHGASVLQVGGGAAFALIVEDDPDRYPIPKEVEHANDVILVVQHFDAEYMATRGAFGGSNDDTVFKVVDPPAGTSGSFQLVNGQYQPTHYIKPGEWQRFRVIYAGWNPQSLDLMFSHNKHDDKHDEKCETFLLAKDGIYINDYPRDLEFFPIPPAGRADIMVRCTNEGTYTVNHFGDKKLFTIVSEGPRVKSEEPTANYFNSTFWLNNLPQYLQDVRNETAGHGCRCPTRLSGRNRINGKTYEPHAVLHTIKLGEVIERNLGGVSFHPYHQHVYPFQVTKGFDKNEWTNASLDSTRGGYFKNGDWHDVIKTGYQREITIKYHPQKVLGKMMIHCHILDHEDHGMMAQEKMVVDHNCACNQTIMSDERLQHYSKKMAILANENN
eukprot:CAMPEP_0170922326 /NCGR_PEP_ID=MMETSP0735-20130129/10390_1 /TAXON_ID=186038 /ORGANISM="Fragilariopsis kerguelensis, Strain L26-C5" /LENGTH=828 /DNA_ID=CAMNT_0011321731 /DNA_START=128 /DNA_END=2614 /DNA_ORIENTATION=-